MSEKKKIESINLENDDLSLVAGGVENDSAIVHIIMYKCRTCGYLCDSIESKQKHMESTGYTHQEFDRLTRGK